jgi:hypothetical protein
MKTTGQDKVANRPTLVYGKNHFDPQVGDFVISCVQAAPELKRETFGEYLELLRSRYSKFSSNLRQNQMQFHKEFFDEAKSGAAAQTLFKYYYMPEQVPIDSLTAMASNEALKIVGAFVFSFQDGLYTSAGFIYEARELLMLKRIKFVTGLQYYEKKRSRLVYEIF